LPPAHPARLILILSLAPVVGLGIGRFAYTLVLPDMRDALGWSYSAAGFMNTVNAAGYLGGALIAARLIRRFGLPAAVRWSALACVLSLALCAITGHFAVLSLARPLAGIGGALGFVSAGALAATRAAPNAKVTRLLRRGTHAQYVTRPALSRPPRLQRHRRASVPLRQSGVCQRRNVGKLARFGASFSIRRPSVVTSWKVLCIHGASVCGDPSGPLARDSRTTRRCAASGEKPASST